MPPQLDLAGGFKGGILIINMVQAMELAQPVGIIEPAPASDGMPDGSGQTLPGPCMPDVPHTIFHNLLC